MRKSFILFALLLYLSGYGQTIRPGGVSGLLYWYDTDSARAWLRSRLATDAAIPIPNGSLTSLNFHPALNITSASQIMVPLNKKDISQASFFTVFHAADTTGEKTIWHLLRNKKTDLVLTTRRMADLESFTYMNYIDLFKKDPKINIYVQHKTLAGAALPEQVMYLGNKPASPALPVQYFTGILPELIIYDRALNTQERLKVASYLALKYGITLAEPGGVYLNSKGMQIWQGERYPSFHHNIAGIGRDDSSGIHQLKAASSNTPGLLTLSANTSLNNYSFLLWGDNGQLLQYDQEKIPGSPLLLGRKWLAIPANISNIATELTIDTRQLDIPGSDKPVYWMAIDHSGSGKFRVAATSYIKMNSLDGNGIASFRNIHWPNDTATREAFTFFAAGNLLFTTDIKQPTCIPDANGRFDIRIHGGRAPYVVAVSSVGNTLNEKRFNINNNTLQLDNISAGKYAVTVWDNDHENFTDTFYVNNSDAPIPGNISSSYLLNENESLKLDAAAGMPQQVSYAWTGPGNFYSSHAAVTIKDAGNYTLITSSATGCRFVQELTVKVKPRNLFDDGAVIVYPNPSSGRFNTQITLPEVSPIQISVYDMSGKLVETRNAKGFANYFFSFDLKVSGQYQLVFQSGKHRTSKSIIITK